jgi:hypothetical protein
MGQLPNRPCLNSGVLEKTGLPGAVEAGPLLRPSAKIVFSQLVVQINLSRSSNQRLFSYLTLKNVLLAIVAYSWMVEPSLAHVAKPTKIIGCVLVSIPKP